MTERPSGCCLRLTQCFDSFSRSVLIINLLSLFIGSNALRFLASSRFETKALTHFCQRLSSVRLSNVRALNAHSKKWKKTTTTEWAVIVIWKHIYSKHDKISHAPNQIQFISILSNSLVNVIGTQHTIDNNDDGDDDHEVMIIVWKQHVEDNEFRTYFWPDSIEWTRMQ